MRRKNTKLLFLVTEDWYFWSHRLSMARAARDAGFDVGIATRTNLHGNRILAEGFSLHQLNWTRGSLSILQFVRAVGEVASLYRRENPTSSITGEVVIGSLAARLSRVQHVVNALTGLGHLFTADEFKTRLLRLVLGPLLRLALRRQGTVVLLQNNDDRTLLGRLGYCNANAWVIRGSGIDLNHFQPLPAEDRPIVTAAFVGRIIEIKGIRVLMNAHKRLREKGIRLKWLLAGIPEVENIGAISRDEIAGPTSPTPSGSATSIISGRSGPRPTSPCCPRSEERGFPKACSKPRPVADRSSRRTFRAPARSRSPDTTLFWFRRTTRRALCDALEHLAGSRELRERYGKESGRRGIGFGPRTDREGCRRTLSFPD